MQERMTQLAHDGLVAISASTATYSWLGAANELVQLVAGIVAICAGLAALRFHLTKTKELQDKEP